MRIDTLVAPVWSRPYVSAPKPPQARKRTSQPKGWEDYASEQLWEQALLAYFRANWRGGHPLWSVVNAVVAEAMPESRWQVRDYTKEVLQTLTELIRQRRVLRYKRKWIAGLELAQEIVPLEQVPIDRLRRT